MAEVGATF